MNKEKDVKNQIRTLLAEAKIYRTQGLFEEAISYYENAAEAGRKQRSDQEQTILSGKYRTEDSRIEKTSWTSSKAPSPSPKMSTQIQDLIKTKFAFSEDKNESALEGAIALAKFGQYERALEEFLELTKVESVRLVAAKNVIRCLVALSTIDDAIEHYQQWLSSELFSQDQLYKLNIFFRGILDTKGIDVTLPQVEEPMDFEISGLMEPNVNDDEFMDISSIGITLDTGSEKGRTIDLDVSFQSGNEINLLISSKDKDLIDNLKVGFRLNDVQFYSPFAIFNGTGVVSAKTQISSGPKQGDYSLDIKVVST